MSLKWDDALLLGNAEIDKEHRQIFSRLEKLSLACVEGRGDEVQHDLLKFLDEYATKHFLHEEAFMARNKYPRLAEQQVQHAHFHQMVKEFQKMDIHDMPAQELSLRIYRRLVLWLNKHIKGLDQEMVNYIRAHHYY
jgi:hemerythrin